MRVGRRIKAFTVAAGLLAGATTLASPPPLAVAQDQPGQDQPGRGDAGDVHPVTLAFERFSAAPAETQAAVVADIERRIADSDDEGVRELLGQVEKARKRLKTHPATAAEFFDPGVYAAGQNVERRLITNYDGSRPELEIYRTWESEYPFASRLRFDFGTDVALTTSEVLAPVDALWNFLYGYPPDADYLLVWLLRTFDHDKDFDERARHFDNLYCDLRGNAYDGVTLYDAFASGQKIDMPDVDVIAYARHVLGDRSFRSPIPAGSKRSKLYKAIQEGFLEYFRHRTLVEATAMLYLDPEAPLREQHEPLRERILYLFSRRDGDPSKVRIFLRGADDRAGMIEKVDAMIGRDRSAARHRTEYAQHRNATRWAIAETAYAVLREYGYLRD